VSSDVAASALERRYRLLLRSYPASYRHRHGDELLDALLAGSAPGARRPDLRESYCLVLGGLRARRVWSTKGRHSDLTALALTGYALIIVAGQLHGSLRYWQRAGDLQPWFAQEVVTAGLLTLLLVLVAAGARRIAVALAGAAVVVPVLMSAHGLPDSVDDSDWWATVLVMLLSTLPGRPVGGSARLRMLVAAGALAAAGWWIVVGPVSGRPLVFLLAALCLAYLGAAVDPQAVVAVAALLLPPVPAAFGHSLFQPAPPAIWAPSMALRLLLVLTCLGFAASVDRRLTRV
jgi:hypothetical protein